MSRSERFSANPDSIRRARTFTSDVLAGIDAKTRATIVLMVSELGTNSVRHGRSDFVVDIDLGPDEVRVTVADDGEDGVPTERVPGHDEPTGRGLQIVGRLADAWGIGDGAQGTSVWFVVELDATREERSSGHAESAGSTG